MSFLSSAFLAALAAMAVPVVIHLIYRQRYPDRDFPTLRFFDKTVKHNVLQRRLIDRLLLALRMLALALLAIGLARPFWHSAFGEKRMSLVIVIDNSPSMSRPREGKPLLDRAKAAAARVLDQLGPADQVEIVLSADNPTAPPIPAGRQLSRQVAQLGGQPAALLVSGQSGTAQSVPAITSDTARLQAAAAKVPEGRSVSLVGFAGSGPAQFGYDHQALHGLLDSVKISAVPGDMHSALAAAGRRLAASTDGDRKIIVISDLQAGDWQGEPAAQLAGLDVKVLTLEPDSAAGPNLGIDNCVVSQPVAGLGQQISAAVTIHNYGAMSSPQATLHMTAGDQDVPAEAKVPPIEAKSSMLVTVPLRVSGRDHLLCTANINSATDTFTYDNTFYFQVGVRPPVTALCVNGTAGATGVDKATFFVMNALSTRGGGSAASADARECETDELKTQKLFQYAVVLLADVPALDPDARQKLRQFVSDGGGLLVFANPSSAADEYNGWGILPARVGAEKGKDFLYVRAMAEKATAVADVRRRAGATVHGLTTHASLALEPADNTTVLARFSDGSPALVEGKIGKGRVILVATSCHVARSDWPLQPAFVLLVRDLVQYLGNGGAAAAFAPTRTVGEGAAMTINPEHAGGTPALFRVSQEKNGPAYQPLPWFREADRLVMPRALESGHYLLAVRPDPAAGLLSDPGLGAEVAPISVNHDPKESDLTAARAELVSRQLPGATVGFETANAETISDLRTGRDLWRWLLAGALIFLAIEGILAWRSASESAG